MVDRIGRNVDALKGISGAKPPSKVAAGNLDFRRILHDAQEGAKKEVKISAHARERLVASRIELSKDDMTRLGDAVDRAAGKGARESLILLGDLALVVSIKNRTVITAVAPDRIKENVFTNIDSAVIT